MKRGSDKKYIHQMYWLPADNLQERVKQDKSLTTSGMSVDF